MIDDGEIMKGKGEEKWELRAGRGHWSTAGLCRIFVRVREGLLCLSVRYYVGDVILWRFRFDDTPTVYGWFVFRKYS